VTLTGHRGWLAASLVALVMTGAGILEAGSDEVFGLAWQSVATALWAGACLLVAYRLPLTGLLLVQVAVVVPVLAWDTRGPGGALLIDLLLMVGYLAFRRNLRLALVGYAVAVVVPSLTLVLADESSWEFVFFGLILGSGLLVGVLLRREQQRTAELTRLARELAVEREHRARHAVDEERARISRELHDAVAHNLSVMTLQVGVVRRRLTAAYPDAEDERETLAAAEELGRASVDELRRVVGLIRPDADEVLSPRASLHRVEDLAQTMRTTGLPVSVVVDGDPVDLPAAVDMSMFRVVQEALTNTMRHAGEGATATVTMSWRPDELVLEVRDTGGAGPAPDSVLHSRDVGGHGLIGMRERVELFGGRLLTGPTESGGFRVTAHVPITRYARTGLTAAGAS
jgi:signal transduction histidine kinase